MGWKDPSRRSAAGIPSRPTSSHSQMRYPDSKCTDNAYFTGGMRRSQLENNETQGTTKMPFEGLSSAKYKGVRQNSAQVRDALAHHD
eukprot:2454965-Pyramimonas_sp.AAC.1